MGGDTVVYYPWDVNGHRCNLAIVFRGIYTPLVADVGILWPPQGVAWRPLLYATRNGVSYACIHGISPNGPDVQALLNQMNVHFGFQGWVVAGDFNREPDTLTNMAWTVCFPNNRTYSVEDPTRRLDYAIRAAADPTTEGEVIGGMILYFRRFPHPLEKLVEQEGGTELGPESDWEHDGSVTLFHWGQREKQQNGRKGWNGL